VDELLNWGARCHQPDHAAAAAGSGYGAAERNFIGGGWYQRIVLIVRDGVHQDGKSWTVSEDSASVFVWQIGSLLNCDFPHLAIQFFRYRQGVMMLESPTLRILFLNAFRYQWSISRLAAGLRIVGAGFYQ
jgi:hypothetical protein